MVSGDATAATTRRIDGRYQRWLELFVLGVVWVYVVVTALVPYRYGTYLAALLALALVSCFLLRLRLRRELVWVGALVAVGLMGLAIGLARDNPGVQETSTIYIIEPLVLGLLFGLAWQVGGWRRTITSALDGALVAAIVVGCALYAAHRLDTTLPGVLVDPTYSYADTDDSTLRTNFQGFNALVFLAPYAVLRVFASRGMTWWWRVVLMASVFLGVVLAGRRVLYFTVPVICVVFIVALCLLARRWIKDSPGARDLLRLVAASALGLVVAAVVVTVVAVPPNEAISRTAGQISHTLATDYDTGPTPQDEPPTTTDESPPPSTAFTRPDVRGDQSDAFVRGIKNSPVWGHGSGAVLPDFVSDQDAPWTYELTYHLTLYSFGILGAAVLLSWTIWMAWQLWRRIRAADALVTAVAAGWLGALAASTLDPYLLKIDGMWMVFVPFSLAVAASVSRRDEASTATLESEHA